MNDGAESLLLRESIAFLQGFLSEMERTRSFMQRLETLKLLVSQLTDADGKSLLTGFRVIDEARLAALDDEVVVEFHKAGRWSWIYAHLLSINNIARLQNHLSAPR